MSEYSRFYYRREMEEEIRDAVVEAIRTFQEKTGMSPQGIDIYQYKKGCKE